MHTKSTLFLQNDFNLDLSTYFKHKFDSLIWTLSNSLQIFDGSYQTCFTTCLIVKLCLKQAHRYFVSYVIVSYLPSNNNLIIGKTPHPQYQYIQCCVYKAKRKKAQFFFFKSKFHHEGSQVIECPKFIISLHYPFLIVSFYNLYLLSIR